MAVLIPLLGGVPSTSLQIRDRINQETQPLSEGSHMPQTPRELFGEREQRVLEAIKLNKPDRVPVIPLFGAFASAYAGISRRDELYDLEKSYDANLKVTLDFTREYGVY
jgi:hypothetical protein